MIEPLSRHERQEEKELVTSEPSLLVDQFAYEVIGAAIEVHRILGPGFLEAVYEQALAAEFDLRKIPYERQYPINIPYKGQIVGEGRLDFFVAKCLVVELKTVDSLLPIHQAQVISYLKATRQHLGLLINFNEYILKKGVRRVVLS
jgi:GxxExxY protein